HPTNTKPVLITGGCGFLGCNIAAVLARSGRNVIVADNLSRAGTEQNAEWLRHQYSDRVTIEIADTRDASAMDDLISHASAVMHLAAQVAVTTSLDRPTEDFDINARGTLNVLESVRRLNPGAPVIFASTNKVYGKLLDGQSVFRAGGHYVPNHRRFAHGVSEDMPLDLYSPYGCSKGAADQYVHDYARIYGLRTVVLRMSCIYGPRQFGNEDQGWIAHFLLQAMRGEPITIYGDGFQVRDALFVDDAVAAWIGCLDQISDVQGDIFNLGGGAANTASLREMLDMVGELRGKTPEIRFAAWRPGDQPWYVSDIRKISAALGWSPRVPLRSGLRALARWLGRDQELSDEQVAPLVGREAAPLLHDAGAKS
ncbi:MAG TPA: NAD-dependent epimerase/dehydratase family protein, partial [Xanthobacteraceae bacterium]|nr:NAD-dependent epimerase/dehydratase family protein [Xanthobacteraceae bacterium]